MARRILVIEDDRGLAEPLSRALRAEGFDVVVSRDGPEGLAKFEQYDPHLVILDLMLPTMHGFDVLRALRRRSDVPVIILTAVGEENDRIAGIELGADDYIVKPFSMRELVARIRMVLRRLERAAARDETIRVGDLVIDRAAHQVKLRDKPIELTPKEFGLLECLARNAGRVMSRQTLLEQVWRSDRYIDERTVDVHIRWLRQKLEDDPNNPKLIQTVRGRGYKLAP